MCACLILNACVCVCAGVNICECVLVLAYECVGVRSLLEAPYTATHSVFPVWGWQVCCFYVSTASSGPCHTCPLHTCLHHTYLSSVFTLTFEHPHQSTHSHLDIHTNTPTLTHQHLCTHYTFVHPYTFSPTHLHLHFPMNSTHAFTYHTDTYTSAPFSFSDYLWGFSPFIPSLASVLFSFIP